MNNKNILNWEEYLELFNAIVSRENTESPYDDNEYLEYVKLNQNRQNRWLKVGKINPELEAKIKKVNRPLNWYLISEPWCGDAAHSTPFIYLLSQLNPLIDFKIVLRDTEPLMIDNYLTNGGKAIPKLVIRDEKGDDIDVWGPRPKKGQDYFLELKEKGTDIETIKTELQKWYNQDKGVAIQDEFLNLNSLK